MRTAAGVLTQGLTALTFITEAYNVQKGDYILVHTIAGGLGLQFAQLLKERGAIVIGTTSTKEKAALAKSYGADHVILYKDENVVERVLDITQGEGVHAVFDGVGKDTCVYRPFPERLNLIQSEYAASRTTSNCSGGKGRWSPWVTRPAQFRLWRLSSSSRRISSSFDQRKLPL